MPAKRISPKRPEPETTADQETVQVAEKEEPVAVLDIPAGFELRDLADGEVDPNGPQAAGRAPQGRAVPSPIDVYEDGVLSWPRGSQVPVDDARRLGLIPPEVGAGARRPTAPTGPTVLASEPVYDGDVLVYKSGDHIPLAEARRRGPAPLPDEEIVYATPVDDVPIGLGNSSPADDNDDPDRTTTIGPDPLA